jgi:hypothetical protein
MRQDIALSKGDHGWQENLRKARGRGCALPSDAELLGH